MSRINSAETKKRLRQRTKELRRTISQMDYVCSGTMTVRTKVCGRTGCRCAKDPNSRHGPYHEWTRREDGRLRHSVVTPQQAKLLVKGIDNHREIMDLMKQWEAITADEVIGRVGKKTK